MLVEMEPETNRDVVVMYRKHNIYVQMLKVLYGMLVSSLL